jgi:glycosyltransferase involved in cell wall biosynthesis
MQIVVSVHALTLHGGTVTYAITVADHLQRLGHDVWLTSPLMGEAAEPARELGVRVVPTSEIPAAPDVILSQDAGSAYELAASHPGVPQVYVAHSDVFDFQLPPALPGVVGAVVTLYDRVDARVRALPAAHRIVRLTQPVDVERFKPLRPLPEHPRVALTLGNYVAGPRAELLAEACRRTGLELRHVGTHGETQTLRPEVVINGADVVFGKARVIAEAMACGRAAYVYDHNGGEGWVTGENRARLATDNFGGQSMPVAVDLDRLTADLARYDPAAALGHRDYVVAHHAATKHAAALVDVLRSVADEPAVPLDAPLRELARMVRLYQRADGHAFVMQMEAHREAAGAEQARAEAFAQAARADREAARADTAVAAEARAWRDAEAHAAAAEEARAAFAAVAGTRRWRALNRLLLPLARLRAARADRRP